MNRNSTLRIIGIDPGLQITGYGVIDYAPLRPRLVDAGVIRLKSRASIPDRLVELEREMDALLAEFEPDCCGVEQLYAHYKHPRTAILMGHARGVILLCATRREIELIELPANKVKKTVTGFGHAGKPQMQRAIQHIFSLPQPPEPPDVADALAIALCAAQSMSPDKVVPQRAPGGSTRKRAVPA